MIHLKVIRPNLWLVGGSLSSPAPRDSLRKTQSLQHTAVLFMSPPTAKWNSLFYKTRTESRQRTNPVLPALRRHIVPLHTVTSGCHYMHHGRMPGGGVEWSKVSGCRRRWTCFPQLASVFVLRTRETQDVGQNICRVMTRCKEVVWRANGHYWVWHSRP